MGLNVDKFSAFFTGRENYNAIDQRDESVVLTHAYIKTGVMLGATLTLDDIACFAVATPEDFDAEAFAF